MVFFLCQMSPGNFLWELGHSPPRIWPQWGTEVHQAKERGRVEKKGIKFYTDCEIIQIIEFPITHVKYFFESRRLPQKSWCLKRKRTKPLELWTCLTFKLVLFHMKISYGIQKITTLVVDGTIFRPHQSLHLRLAYFWYWQIPDAWGKTMSSTSLW